MFAASNEGEKLKVTKCHLCWDYVIWPDSYCVYFSPFWLASLWFVVQIMHIFHKDHKRKSKTDSHGINQTTFNHKHLNISNISLDWDTRRTILSSPLWEFIERQGIECIDKIYESFKNIYSFTCQNALKQATE